MTNETQYKKVLKQLRRTGKVSRNWCLQRFITRLSAIIFDFKKAGLKFSAGYEETPNGGRDYLYVLRNPEKLKK